MHPKNLSRAQREAMYPFTGGDEQERGIFSRYTLIALTIQGRIGQTLKKKIQILIHFINSLWQEHQVESD